MRPRCPSTPVAPPFVTMLLVCSVLAPAALRAGFTINLGNAPPRYKGVVAVKDEAATGKVAYKTTEGISGVIHFGYSGGTRMGIFEATFRLKVADNTIKEPVARVRYNCEGHRLANVPPELRGSRSLKGTDFGQAGVYQEFKVQWVGPHKGLTGWATYTTGKTEVWVDCIKVTRVRNITEGELLAYLPGATDPPDPQPRVGPWRAHLMRGFFSDYFLLDLALPQIPGIQVTSSSFRAEGGCAGQPGTAQALYRYDVLIMAGTNIVHLHIPQRVALTKWVEAGGGLFMLGGPVSFGQAAMNRSVVRELLPVELQGGFDLKRDKIVFAPHPAAADHPILEGLDLAQPMVTLFRHQVPAKAGATIVLGTDDKPLLVVADRGKGRVACFLGAPMGRASEAGEGEAVFWNDPRLPTLFRNVVRYLITRPVPAAPLRWQPDGKPSAAAMRIIESLDDPDLEGGLDDLDEAGGDEAVGLGQPDATEGRGPPNLKKEDIELLIREGGKPAVPLLLRSLPSMTDRAQVRRIEWTVRPFIGKRDYPELKRLYASLSPMSGPIRESALSLMGKSDPHTIHPDLIKHLLGKDRGLMRAAARSALEGKLRKLLPHLKRIHGPLKEEVEHRRLSKYQGYWFDGIRPDDPIWAYAECTMALLVMGEKGYVRDACDLLALLHLQHIKIRSFIFLYNPRVPREVKMAERHRKDNAFTRPDLERLLVRFRRVLSALPEPLHAGFRKALLEIEDFEKLLRLLYPAYDLAAANDTEEWLAFHDHITRHAFQRAIAADRF